jgi:nucleotide-binding universal stress UspA family protein
VTTTGRPVVVGVDDSDGGLAAVRWAARHASETDAPLRLVHAVTPTDRAVGVDPPPSGDIPARTDRVLDAAVAQAVPYGRPEGQVSTCTASDAAVTALIEASSEAGLLVIGSHGRSRWATLFSSVSTRVVAAAQCPVVVVRGDDEPSGPVVVAVDASGTCGSALRFAFTEAARRRCTLVAVHAWQTPLVAAGAGMRAGAVAANQLSDEDIVTTAWRSLTDTVGEWRAAFPDVVVRERLVRGDPETVMTNETSGAALVVVGSRGRGPVSGLLLGSTSQSLVHTANCPVAVVRNPDGDRTDTPTPVNAPGSSSTVGV